MLENKLFKFLVEAQRIGCGVACRKVLQEMCIRDSVKKALEPLCEKGEVTLSPAIAVVTVKEPLKIEDVNAALAKAGDYSATPLN